MVSLAPHGGLPANETALTVKQASLEYSVHTRTIERWFRKGLEGWSLGGKLYTTKQAVSRFSQPYMPGPGNEPTKRQRDAVDADLDRSGW